MVSVAPLGAAQGKIQAGDILATELNIVPTLTRQTATERWILDAPFVVDVLPHSFPLEILDRWTNVQLLDSRF